MKAMIELREPRFTVVSNRNEGDLLPLLTGLIEGDLGQGKDVVLSLAAVTCEGQTALDTLCGYLCKAQRVALQNGTILVIAHAPEGVGEILRDMLPGLPSIPICKTVEQARIAIGGQRRPIDEAAPRPRVTA